MKRLLAAALLLSACGHRPEPPSELFRDIAAQSGLVFQHVPGVSGEYYMPEIMGAGCALFDFDNDGDLDVYLVQGMPLEGAAPAGLKPGNRLYRNELIPSGKLTFTDVTERSGAGHIGYGMGVATGDYNGDGYVDLYVTNFGANVLYRNNGDGTFTDVTRQAGVEDQRWSTSAAFVDYDRDGDLDLFVLNYVDFSLKNHKRCFAPTGERDYCTPKAYNAVTASLFRNDGNGRFTDVSTQSRINSSRGPGLGITVTDANDDGWPDLYVANDTAANLLWVNRTDGTFREQGLAAGVAYSEDGLAKAGMGVATGDFDNDGDEDLFVVNLTREGATLFRREAPMLYQDVSLATGLRPATYAFTGFGTDWFDYDHDGFLDLFIANGAVTLMEELRGQPYPFRQKNALLHNEGGKRFSDVSSSAGAAMNLVEVSRGAAFGDIDNDGDIDILLTNNNGPVRLLENLAGNGKPSVMLKLEMPGWNRYALGARVRLEREGMPPLLRRVHTDSSYLSANDPRVHFGLGGGQPKAVVVEWPDGRRQRYTAITAGKLNVLRR
ncbi:MAG: CRTAC1 family protein [Acidobacteria bacterium]|nr:CRTAC1 family protein [Acidobacteriota bacterium]